MITRPFLRTAHPAVPVAVCALLVATPAAVAALPQSETAPSQTAAAAVPVTLEELLTVALSDNPDLLAARARVAAALQRPDQANALPDPTLGLMVRNVAFPEPTVGIEMMSMAGISFTQALPAAGKRPLRRAVAQAGIDVATASYRAIRRRIVREVASAFFELVLVTESTRVVEETRTLLTDLEATAAARYAVGEGIQQDVLKAQVETSVLINRLIRLEQDRASTVTRLNRLLARSASAPLAPPVPTVPPEPGLELPTLQRLAAEFSALLDIRHEQLERQQATVELARKETRSDFVVGGSWMHRGGLPDIWQLNLGITLPVRKDQRQNRAIEESEHELEALRHERRSTELDVAEQVRISYLRADRSRRLRVLFRDGIIPQAVLSLESAMAGYSVGTVDFLTVLNNVVTLLTYRLELQLETASYMTSLATIEEHIGRSLGATPASVLPDPSALADPPEPGRSEPDRSRRGIGPPGPGGRR